MTLLFPAALFVLFLCQLHGWAFLQHVIRLAGEVERDLGTAGSIYKHVPGPADPAPWGYPPASRPARF